jgi:nicotinamide-nucleotide amidase
VARDSNPSEGNPGTDEVRAGILVTGNEVLNATITDRNSPWLSEVLAGEGVAVDRVLVVPDDDEAIGDGLEHLRSRGVDLILTSGGLGPTADDRTAAAVGRFTGREMVLDPGMEARIREILNQYAAARGNDVPLEGLDEANRKQAMVPEGSTPLDPVGTAPGLVVPGPGGVVVVVLPGPPRELQPMWAAAAETPEVASVLSRAGVLMNRRLRMFGIPESRLAAELRALEQEAGMDFDELEITTCLRKGELEIDLRYREGGEEAAALLAEALQERFSKAMFSPDGRTIDEIVSSLFVESGLSVAVAESCTAGLLAARLASLPGASRYLVGGAVTYSNDAKESLLDVGKATLERFGAVSPETAAEMATGARVGCAADIGVGITGIAGPEGGTADKPVGYVCFNVDGGDLGRIEASPVIPGDRNEIRERSTLVAMHLLRQLLAGEV